MSEDADGLAMRLTAQFRQYGGEGQYTRLFANVDPEIQHWLLHLARVEDGEEPIIAAYVDDAHWMLLTSQRLRWSEDGIKTVITLPEIKGTSSKLSGYQRATASQSAREDIRSWWYLTIATKQGAMDLACEPEEPFFGLMHALWLAATIYNPQSRKPRLYTPADLATFFVRKFSTYEKGQYTRLFSNFEPETQQRLLQLAEIEAKESPAVAAYLDDTHWIVVTNSGLYWLQNGIRRCVALTDIEAVETERKASMRAKFPDGRRFSGLPPLHITVVTKQGKMNLELEARGPFFGFMVGLETVAMINRTMREIDLQSASPDDAPSA